MATLEGHVVVITGASRGLGASMARAFAAQGAHLVLAARGQAALDELAQSLPSALAVQCDVASRADLRNLVDAAVGEFGRLDVFVNNAGVAVYGPFLDASEEDFDEMVSTNLRGTFFGSQVALDTMRRFHRGLIINIGSIAGALHLPNEAAYSATKWAIRGLTGVLRLEAAEYNVKVSCVLAGGIDTPFWKEKDYVPFPPEVDPARDFLAPDEVAQLVVDLALRSDRFVVPEVVCLPLMPSRAGS